MYNVLTSTLGIYTLINQMHKQTKDIQIQYDHNCFSKQLIVLSYLKMKLECFLRRL